MLIDSSVWNADRILWWGSDHRIAVVVKGDDFRKIDIIHGKFTQSFLDFSDRESQDN